MCLAIPRKIKSISGNIAIIRIGSDCKEINIRSVSDVNKNDWVLVNQNFAVSKIAERDVLKIRKLFSDIKNVDNNNVV